MKHAKIIVVVCAVLAFPAVSVGQLFAMDPDARAFGIVAPGDSAVQDFRFTVITAGAITVDTIEIQDVPPVWTSLDISI